MDRLINRKVLSLTFCIILILVFTLTIAYAALSTTLNIFGNAEISDASWNIKFSNIKVNPSSVSISPKITNNTTLTFSANLENPGEFYKFTVDIVNDGTIDAMIDSIIKTPELTTEQKKYLRYEVKYSDGQDISVKQMIKAKETKTISVLFSFRNDIPVSDLPTTDANFNVQLQIVYYQADDTAATLTNGVSKVNVVSGDGTNVGDEICIEKECFYVISSNSHSVTMLAKYNLLIGNTYDGTNGEVPLENPTGIQDIIAKGWFEGYTIQNPVIGSIQFSTNNYWQSSNFETSLYIYDSNSYTYNYVETYKEYLQSFQVKINNARLINYDELIKLGCNGATFSCNNSYSWIRTSTYWTGSAASIDEVWHVNINSSFRPRPYNVMTHGIRPVIEIPLTEF